MLPFKGNYPVSADYNYHLTHEKGYAIDYATPMGTQLVAVANGVVTRHNTWWGGSDTIILKGDNQVYYLYAHCRSTLKEGRVRKGDVIGLSGNDGNSTGPHLHFSADKDYNRMIGYSTATTSRYIDEVLNNKGVDYMDVKFLGRLPYQPWGGNVAGYTDNEWYTRVMPMSFFPDWYVVEFKFGVFTMKSSDINGNLCVPV